jgi:hypothetical protein
MSNGFEIAGACFTTAGGLWLLVDALRIRHTVRAEEGASRLREILDRVGAGDILKDGKGNPLNSEKALRLWFAARTIAWNWIALALITAGFVLDLIGKIR